MNEIYLLCLLDHPNIVRVHETFRDDDHFYIVMEYFFMNLIIIGCVRAAPFTMRSSKERSYLLSRPPQS